MKQITFPPIKAGDSTYYNVIDQTIILSSHEMKDLTKDEQIIATCDSIIHEHMHYLIFQETYNETQIDKFNKGYYTSISFDTIQQHFRLPIFNLIEVKEKFMSWEVYIRTFGIEQFFKQYGVTKENRKLIGLKVKE